MNYKQIKEKYGADVANGVHGMATMHSGCKVVASQVREYFPFKVNNCFYKKLVNNYQLTEDTHCDGY